LGGGDRGSLRRLPPDALLLSPAAAGAFGVTTGGTLALQSGLDVLLLRVAGVLTTDGAQAAVMDIAAVQQAFGHLGRLSRIDLRRPRHERRAARRAGARAAARRRRPATRGQPRRERRLTRSYRVNLNVLALMALFTGGLLFSTHAVDRAPSGAIALLRVIG
jgi:putative ABC transport system permease protein